MTSLQVIPTGGLPAEMSSGTAMVQHGDRNIQVGHADTFSPNFNFFMWLSLLLSRAGEGYRETGVPLKRCQSHGD